MKYIKLFENFLGNNDFLVEKDWKKYIPEDITIKKEGKKAKYELRDSMKNLSSVSLVYNLEETDSETMPNTLTITLSFKMKNDSETPMVDNTFECTLEVMMGTLYIIGTKITNCGKNDFIPKLAEIDNSASSKIAKLIKYASGDTLKITSIK